MDHDWPDELDSDATCARCGLRYDEWTVEETLWCTGESR